MWNMKDILESAHIDQIPQLSVIRHVPIRYRRILSLSIMKQYQCIVVGAAPGVLTVAITDRQNMPVIESLSRYTGRAIFPVLIEAKRMRLLIQRIERWEQYRRIFYSKGVQAKEIEYYQYATRRLQISSLLMLLSSQKTKNL